MPYIPTAPDLKAEIADLIRAHRKRHQEGGRWFTPNVKNREEAGRFTTAGDAIVVVEAVVTFSQQVYYPHQQKPVTEDQIQVGAAATCHGYGCIAPSFEQDVNNSWLLHEEADEPAARVLEPVQAAREWAQKHAETCCAQPYTG